MKTTPQKYGPVAVLLMSLVSFAALAVYITRGLAFGTSFYEATAQVIPVFLLVTVVEARFFADRPRSSDFDQRMRRMLFVVVLAGEAVALYVLARGGDTLALRGAVLTALLVVGVMFLIYAFDGPVAQE